MHLIAIGGSDAGISAALRARELDPVQADLNGATGYRSSPRYTSRRCPTTETVTTRALSSTS
jgi:hypothetical protein